MPIESRGEIWAGCAMRLVPCCTQPAYGEVTYRNAGQADADAVRAADGRSMVATTLSSRDQKTQIPRMASASPLPPLKPTTSIPVHCAHSLVVCRMIAGGTPIELRRPTLMPLRLMIRLLLLSQLRTAIVRDCWAEGKDNRNRGLDRGQEDMSEHFRRGALRSKKVILNDGHRT